LVFAKNNNYLMLIISLFIILIVLTLNSSVVCAEISDFGLEYDNSPVDKISLSNPMPFTTVFYVNNEEKPLSINVNFSDLVSNSFYKQDYSSISVPGSSCNWDNASSSYKCGINNVMINPETKTVTLGFNLSFMNYAIEYYTYTHTFEIDNDSPTLQGITSDYCYDNQCYLKNGNNKLYFEFDDETENFARRNVYFKFNNNIYQVKNCASGICTTVFTQQCASGMMLPISLVVAGNYKSEDDAGNPISSDINENVVCDSITPYNNGLSYGVTYETVNGPVTDSSSIEFITTEETYNIITGGKSLDIKAYVFEDGPVLYAKANLTSIGGSNEEVSCTQSNDYPNLFICDFSVSTLFNEYMQKNLEFEFIDLVNHSYTIKKKIIVKKGADSSTSTPDCINLGEENFYPSKINRIALELAQTNSLSYPLYAPFKLEKKSGSYCKGIQANEIKIEDCFIYTSNGSLMSAFGNYFDDDAEIKYPYQGLDKNNYIDLDISIDPNAIDSTTFICNFSVYISDDENVYSEPLFKQIEWDVILKNSAFGRPGEEYTQRIKDKTKVVESDLDNLIGILNNVLTTASQLCKIGRTTSDILGQTHLTMDIVDKIMASVNVNVGLGPATANLQKPIEASVNGGDVMAIFKNKDIISGIFTTACTVANCPMNKNLKQTSITEGEGISEARNWYYTGDDFDFDKFDGPVLDTDTFDQKLSKSLLGNLGTADLYDSMLACVSTGCLPCIVYHANKWREAECDRLYCLKRQAQYGLSIEACDVSLKTFACKTITGEFFELPYVRQIMNLKDNFNNLAQNLIPQTLTDFVSDQTCTETYKRAIANPSAKVDDISLFEIIECEIPLTLGRYIRNKNLGGSSSGSFSYPIPKIDICKLALCNEENESECETGAGYFPKLLNNKVTQTVFGRSESAFEEMARLQDNNRNKDEGKPYSNELNEYTRLASACVKYGSCENADQKLYDAAMEAHTKWAVKKDGPEPFLPKAASYYNTAGKLEDSADDLKYDYNTIVAGSEKEIEDICGKLDGDCFQKMGDLVGEGIFNANYQSQAGYSYSEEEVITAPENTFEDKDTLAYAQIGYDFLYKDEKPVETFEENQIMQIASAQNVEKSEQVGGYELQAAIEKYAIKTEPEQDRENQIKDYLKDNCEKLFTNPECKAIKNVDGTLDKEKLRVLFEEGGENTKNKVETLNAELKTYKEEKATRAKFDSSRATAKLGIDLGVSWLWNNYLKDLGSLSDLGKRFDSEFLVDLSDTLNNMLSSDAWIDNICNPNNIGFMSGDYDLPGGTAVDCSEKYCTTVLTMAMERSIYSENMSGIENPDEYLYTFVYLMNEIDQNYEFNIYFKTNDKETCVYQDNNNECKNRAISEGESASRSIAFLSENYYTRVCFEFDKNFPQYAGKRIYCRNIVESDFDTGQPDRDYDSTQVGTNNETSQGINEIFG